MLTSAEVLERYGKVPLLFNSYYKYSFGFSGIAPDGARVYKSVGGDSDNIYRYEVSRDVPEFLAPEEWVTITDSSGAELFSGDLRGTP